MEAGVERVSEKITTQVAFERPDTTMLAATQATLAEKSPVTGSVIEIELHFPNGCNALVEISCFINQQQILPVTGFIALNDATRTYTVNRNVRKNDQLRVIIANRDGGFSHTPSIIWTLAGVP